MRNKIISTVVGVLIFLLLISGKFADIFKFFAWLIMLNMTQSSVSLAGEIFVRIATFVISFGLVGIVFNALGWFNSDIMKLAFFIVSTLISFGLCYVVMIFETYILYITIAIGVIMLGLIAVGVVSFCRSE